MQLNKQWKTCDQCGKHLSCCKSLWRHRKICRPTTRSGGNNQSVAGQKRSLPSSVTSYPEISVAPAINNPKVEAMKKNPKVQALLEAVINDSSDHVERYIPFNEPMARISSYTAPPTIIEVEKPVVIPDYKVKEV